MSASTRNLRFNSRNRHFLDFERTIQRERLAYTPGRRSQSAARRARLTQYPRLDFRVREVNALQQHATEIQLATRTTQYNFAVLLSAASPGVLFQIDRFLGRHPTGCKFNLGGYAVFRNNETGIEFNARFLSKSYTIHGRDELIVRYEEAEENVLKASQNIARESSNVQLIRCNTVFVRLVEYQPVRGGCHIELPPWIEKKHACINIENLDNQCFHHCLELFYRQSTNNTPKHPERASHYIGVNSYIYPPAMETMGIHELCKQFEKYNPRIQLKIIGLQSNTRGFTIIYKSNYEVGKRCVNLLYIGKNDYTDGHFVFIKNLNRLLGQSGRKRYFCENCLNGFWSIERLKIHQAEFGCTDHDACTIELPFPDQAIFTFQKLLARRQLQHVIYADFECLLRQPTEEEKENGIESIHDPCGWCIYWHTTLPVEQKLFMERLGRDASSVEDLVSHFYERLMTIRNYIVKMTLEEGRLEPEFEECVDCKVCRLPLENGRRFDFRTEEDSEVVDGSYHRYCLEKIQPVRYKKCKNGTEEYEVLQLKWDFKIPVVFHNLKNYDGHILLRHLSDKIQNITCIPHNGEKFMTFSFSNLSFIDSYLFLSDSLDVLTKKLKKQDFHHFQSQFDKICHNFCTDASDELFQLMLRKGVYPYEYMDSVEKFDETAIPLRASFFSNLSRTDISEEDYDHAINVFESMNIHTLGDYHDLYLLTDVMLLADVCTKFRADSYEETGLDPFHYVSLPGFAKDAALTMQNRMKVGEIVRPFHIQLFNCNQMDMHLFVERGIRGGLTLVPGRYAEKTPDSEIVYYDANGLYSYSMLQPLPMGDYEWLPDSMLPLFSNDTICALDPHGEKGFIFEVDLHFPTSTHDYFRDMPPAPTKMVITKDMLTDYQKSRLERCIFTETEKLCCPLWDRKNYVVDYRNLKLYLELGVKVTKVHRILRFTQFPWLKSFIELYTNLRLKAKAEGDHMKDLFYKLTMNCVFGKTMEDARRHRKIRIVTTRDQMLKYTRNPLYETTQINTEASIMMEFRKEKVQMRTPILVGMVILELSKAHMIGFYYKVIKNTFGNNVRLLMTDTDSLIMQIRSPNGHFQALQANNHLNNHFDLSSLPTNHPFHSTVNFQKPGYFKNETKGRQITSFVGSSSKMYSIIGEDGLAIRKAKGINKRIMDQEELMQHQRYVDCVLNHGKAEKITILNFRSKNQQIQTIRTVKYNLTEVDSKLLTYNGVDTLPHGHYSSMLLPPRCLIPV